MADKTAKINSLIEELFENDTKVIHKSNKLKKLVKTKAALKDKKQEPQETTTNHAHAGGTVVHGDNTTVNTPMMNYKFDDSAANEGRKPISKRVIGKKVDPKQMTPKEYGHYLAYKFNLTTGKGWDGIENRPYQQNWTENPKQNITSIDGAAAFFGFKLQKDAPDGIEKRKKPRRTNKKDIRSTKQNRRVLSAKGRRKQDLANEITYFMTMIILFIVIGSWIAYSTYLKMGELAG